jgi:cobalt-zinc-cadmium resistance protein CzcA
VLKSILAFGLTRRAIILLGLLVFIGAGAVAFTKLNIEAYPNPAPVILEITAQAAGLSAEEMERYYTIPMEIGLYPTPGIDNIRSTSFYGLTFVRVTFRYGVDYHFAYTQAALSLTQNVTLPGNQIPQIQQSSLVGEVYRYQVVGPPHFGLTNLRTVQDWIATRGLFTVTDGVVAVNSWGAPPSSTMSKSICTRSTLSTSRYRKSSAHSATPTSMLAAVKSPSASSP